MSPAPSEAIDAQSLAEETLRILEMNELPLSTVAMRASRLARLLNEVDYERIFRYEVGGYPVQANGLMTDEDWRLAGLANRYFTHEDEASKKSETRAYTESIEVIESALAVARERIPVAADRAGDQRVWGNVWERAGLSGSINLNVTRLAARRALVHWYLASRFHQLRYSGITSDAFARLRATVDSRIVQHVPTAVERFDSVYANLQSTNPEDWANAVHSCRRILEDLADSLFPAQTSDRLKDEKAIKLGPTHYKNRLLCYIEDRSSSATFVSVVGSTLAFIEDRLNALFDAANKGTHAAIDRAEADRYVIYTYLIVGDVLSL